MSDFDLRHEIHYNVYARVLNREYITADQLKDPESYLNGDDIVVFQLKLGFKFNMNENNIDTVDALATKRAKAVLSEIPNDRVVVRRLVGNNNDKLIYDGSTN